MPTSGSEIDPADVAGRVIDANAYMTLATADEEGRPWASPVWFAHDGYASFFWVSRPDARHSRNLAVRSQVGIVVFDSTIAVGGAEAVYVEAEAEQVSEAERDRALAVYSRRSEAHGGGPWAAEDVMGSATHRLYRATASAHYLLLGDDTRRPVRFDG